MDRELLKKPWPLAGLLLVVNVIQGSILLFVVETFKIGSSGIAGIAGIIGAMLVGQIYALSFKEVMPQKLRLLVTIIYIVVQIVFGGLYFLILGLPDLLFLFGILVGVSLIYSLLIYLMLSVGGKTYLKALERKNLVKK